MASFGSILGEFRRRLTFLWRRRQIDLDLAEEIRFHVNMKTRAAVDAGAPAGEAHRAAHLQFGGATLWREISREAGAGPPSLICCRTCAMPRACCAIVQGSGLWQSCR